MSPPMLTESPASGSALSIPTLTLMRSSSSLPTRASITFGPLPVLPVRKRRSTTPLGVAARSQLVRLKRGEVTDEDTSLDKYTSTNTTVREEPAVTRRVDDELATSKSIKDVGRSLWRKVANISTDDSPSAIPAPTSGKPWTPGQSILIKRPSLTTLRAESVLELEEEEEGGGVWEDEVSEQYRQPPPAPPPKTKTSSLRRKSKAPAIPPPSLPSSNRSSVVESMSSSGSEPRDHTVTATPIFAALSSSSSATIQQLQRVDTCKSVSTSSVSSSPFTTLRLASELDLPAPEATNPSSSSTSLSATESTVSDMSIRDSSMQEESNSSVSDTDDVDDKTPKEEPRRG